MPGKAVYVGAIVVIIIIVATIILLAGPHQNTSTTQPSTTSVSNATQSSIISSNTTTHQNQTNATIYAGNWTIDSGSRISGQSLNGVPSAIQLQNGSIRLYYCTTNSTGVMRIVSSTAKNGLNFTADSGIRISHGNISVCNPSILLLSNGSYRIYYSTFIAGGNRQQLYTAISKDGLNFTNNTPLIDPQNPNWNNATGFASEPAVHYAPNGTFVMYYNSFAAGCNIGGHPIPTQGSAVSKDGVHFILNGCLMFPQGYNYFSMPFSDFDWSLLPNGTSMFIGDYLAPPSGQGQLPPNAKGSSYYGFYSAYSTDNTLLHYTNPKLIIKMPWPTGWFSDQAILELSNGTYKMYYNLHINESGMQSVVIDSATWVPIKETIKT